MADQNPFTPGTDNVHEVLRKKPKDKHGDGQWGDVKKGKEDSSPRHHDLPPE